MNSPFLIFYKKYNIIYIEKKKKKKRYEVPRKFA